MNDELFGELVKSIKQAGDIKRGREEPARRTLLGERPDVLAIREKLHLTRDEFASLLCVSTRTLEGWEQGRRQPTGPAKMLLQVARQHPRALIDTAKKLEKELVSSK
jgi:putative transcriptional regulator